MELGEQIDAKIKLINDLTEENNNLPLPATHEEYIARENAFNEQIKAIKKEIVELFKANAFYKRVLQMKDLGLI